MSDDHVKVQPCPECAETGKAPSYDDDGEPIVYRSGKREGEIKVGKCPACDGEGTVEA